MALMILMKMKMKMKMIKFDDVGYLVMKVMKVIIVKEVMTCDVLPVAIFFMKAPLTHAKRRQR